MEKGTYEARQWLKNYSHPRGGLPFVGAIHDFIIYRKFCKTCTDEEIYQLNKWVQQYGLNHALRMMINEVRQNLIRDAAEKRRRVEALSNPTPLSQKWEREKFEKEMEEAILEEGLTREQREKRNAKYPFNGGNIHTIPESALKSAKIVDQGIYKGIVKYTIYDKIYNCWSAEITAPFVKVAMIRKYSLEEVKDWTERLLRKTYNLSIDEKDKRIREAAKQPINKAEVDAQEKVQKIKEILGQDKNNDLNSPDIF